MSADETQPLKPTRTSFVRSLPLSMPVEEVIERGREAGVTIQPSDVHSVRYYMRQEADAELSAVPEGARVIRPLSFQLAGLKAAPPAPEAPAKAEPAQRTQRNSVSRKRPAPARSDARSDLSVEQQLRVFALRVGTDRVRAILEDLEESTLRVVLGTRPTRPTR